MQECKKSRGKRENKKTRRKEKRNGTNTYYLHEYTCFCFVSSLLPFSITPSMPFHRTKLSLFIHFIDFRNFSG